MWFFNKQREILGISIYADRLDISIINSYQNKYAIRVCDSYYFSDTHILESILFNNTQLIEILSRFTEVYNLQSPYTIISFDDNLIKHGLDNTPISSVPIQDADHYMHLAHSFVIGDMHHYYHAFMHQALILQLRLICHSLNYEIISITTHFMIIYTLAQEAHFKLAYANPISLTTMRLEACNYLLAWPPVIEIMAQQKIDVTSFSPQDYIICLGQHILGTSYANN
jgi:hypothetical protein